MAISKEELNRVNKRIAISTKDLTNSRGREFLRKSLSIDKLTLSKVSSFQERTGLDFSSSIRYILNDYLK